MRIIITLVLSVFISQLWGQSTFPENQVRDTRNTVYAFTNGYIFTAKQKLERASLLIQNGKVLAVGTNITIPENAVTQDLNGKVIYPSFIDLYSDYGMPEVEKPKKGEAPQYHTTQRGTFGSNQALHPQKQAAALFEPDEKKAEALRKQGFGVVLTQQQDGILRGTSALVKLGTERANKMVVAPSIASGLSFDKGTSPQQYPGSLMGAIALIRQTYYNTEWYAQQSSPEINLTLEAFHNQLDLPVIFEVSDYLTALRAAEIAQEFEVQYIFKGNGDEYKRKYDIKSTEAAYILPLNFPDAYEISDPYDALFISLEDMKHWELAPSNARQLAEIEVPFAFTVDGLEKPEEFLENLRKTVTAGLPKEKALAALTRVPAQLIGADDQVGTLEPGKQAHFFIASDSLFQPNAKIIEHWIDGKVYPVERINEVSIAGEYILTVDKIQLALQVTEKKGKYSAQISEREQTKVKAKVERINDLITLQFNWEDALLTGPVRLSGKINYKSKIWDGRGQDGEGNWLVWSAIRQEEGQIENDTVPTEKRVDNAWFPNMAYGWDTLPKREDFIIRKITIWSNDTLGKFVGDVRVENGKIAAVGRNLEYDETLKVISGKGLHLTPGIVDEHSHIAISKGVNEPTYNSSAMVRIGDVVNPDDINIYRQLSGGVTTSQLLHGSANPIGGQSALVKLKWGYSADAMKIDNAPGFIKFALGENVKQSNWGDKNTVRFPQTRMGVEQVFYDRFYRAKEYDSAWFNYGAEKKRFSLKKLPVVKKLTGYENPQPRRDLELDALAEILESQRFISCHSYMQHEITMLMHVADSMGFRVNTFTHILEGYKVADKLREHGANASTFSDWWAYKFEVNDAIPYNAALLHENGVNTGINSDDAEMGRRLNQEAAKTVKYGGVSEEEAIKMVTLNPAKMLHLDHRIGSITPGKDADLVIWTDHPLSIYSKVKTTYIEGVAFYDAERDLKLREKIKTERARLIKRMIEAQKKGAKTQKPKPTEQLLYECNTILEDYMHE